MRHSFLLGYLPKLQSLVHFLQLLKKDSSNDISRCIEDDAKLVELTSSGKINKLLNLKVPNIDKFYQLELLCLECLTLPGAHI